MNIFDRSLLEPFAGYLSLGMFEDANDALEDLPNGLKVHPLVLGSRLTLLIAMKRWEDSVILARSLTKLWPEEPAFYFQTSFCLHELRRTSEAKAALMAAPADVQGQPHFLFKLACYEAQLGNVARAKELLKACFEEDEGMKQAALDDPDLKPVWSILSTQT